MTNGTQKGVLTHSLTDFSVKLVIITFEFSKTASTVLGTLANEILSFVFVIFMAIWNKGQTRLREHFPHFMIVDVPHSKRLANKALVRKT